MNVAGVLSVVNCKKTPCASGKCCSQDGANNGVCISDEATCDRRLGLPAKDYRDKIRAQFPVLSESFDVMSREGYKNQDDNDCSNWNDAMFVMLVIFVLVLALVIIHFRNRLGM